jgi:CRP/FNR family cyclic AMP-dependent transcriptional regulator
MRKVLYILGELEDSDLQWILDAGTPLVIAADHDVISEGATTEHLFILIDGELRVTKNGHELARLGAGEIVGEMSMLDSRPPSATVTAKTSSTVFAIPRVAMRAKLDADKGFAARFYRALCVFLANRLSRSDTMIGVGARSVSEVLESDEDEITPEALENMALAGARFDWFLQRVRTD